MKTALAALLCTASSLLLLGGCLEPQPAPDLPQEPSSRFQLNTIADGLARPWAAAELPDGGFLVTGRFGQLWRVSPDGTRTDITGLPADIAGLGDNRIAAEGQGGLLDVALAPDFARSGTVYLSYSYGDWDANGTALLRAQLDGDSLSAPAVIFRAGPAKAAGSHYGGKIAFLPDDSLLLTLGDAFALREEAQKPSSHLGSIVRLLPDGGTPSDNPDFGPDAKPQLYSIGHRNVQGLAVDPQTGTVWEHEHGPRGGDELNIIEPGENYGWPIVTYGRDYQGARISPRETDPRFVAPVRHWVPSIAPSGLTVYRGDVFPDWDGDLLIGGLASGDLRRVSPDGSEETVLLGDLKGESDSFRVRDVDVASDGSVLLLIEDTENGRLLRLNPRG